MVGLIPSLAVVASTAAGAVSAQYYTSPPVYPSPNTTGLGGWEAALEKAQGFLAQLSLEEKAGVVTGTTGPCSGNIGPIPRLNFSGLCLQDGPLAIRQAVSASVFPAGLSAAASWDRDMVKLRGQYIGEEFKGKGAHIALGPVVGPLGRSPYGGRNWEGFSPDPYLAGELVEESIMGMQGAGVQACVKHYIANEQETQRNPSEVNGTTVAAVSSDMDDKTMHETYLFPFVNAIHAGAASVMCSYNRINGSYACQNSKTLNGLLKDELGFQGYVVSDWTGTRSGVPAIQAGLDMNMPGGINFLEANPSYFGQNLTTAVNNASLSIERVDDMVLRIMTPYYYLNQDVDFPPIDETSEPLGFFPKSAYVYNFTLGPFVDVRADHGAFIRELGAAGTVLLKNENSTLPLDKPKNVGIFGYDAADVVVSNGRTASDFEAPADPEGTLPTGGGSGAGTYSYLISPLEAIKARALSYGAIIQYATDNNAIVGQDALSHITPTPDVCLLFLKSWAVEGQDRTSLLADSNSTETVETVAAMCANTIVVIHGAGPVVMPWKDHENVTAIVAAHMPGQETGNSIVDVLWGEVNPSGKLPYTIANKESDYTKNLKNTTSTNSDDWNEVFSEGNLIDYKEFDAKNMSVAYEFGFGLSYTTFEVSDMQVASTSQKASRVPSTSAKIVPGGNEQLFDVLTTVSATVKNTGKLDGATVPQLYISLPASEAGPNTPVRMLRGFDKVTLAAGESTTVEFPLLRRDLSFWDVTAQTWRLPSSAIGVSVGLSSRDLPLKGEITV